MRVVTLMTKIRYLRRTSEEICVGQGAEDVIIKDQIPPAEVSIEHTLTHLPMRGTERDVSGIF